MGRGQRFGLVSPGAGWGPGASAFTLTHCTSLPSGRSLGLRLLAAAACAACHATGNLALAPSAHVLLRMQWQSVAAQGAEIARATLSLSPSTPSSRASVCLDT